MAIVAFVFALVYALVTGIMFGCAYVMNGVDIDRGRRTPYPGRTLLLGAVCLAMTLGLACLFWVVS
jgi:hypothetical protein